MKFFVNQRTDILKEFQAFMLYESKIPSRVTAHYLKVSHQMVILYIRDGKLPSLKTATRMAHFLEMTRKIDGSWDSLITDWEREGTKVQQVAIKDLKKKPDFKGVNWERFYNIMFSDQERHLKRQYLTALILASKKNIEGVDTEDENKFIKAYEQFKE